MNLSSKWLKQLILHLLYVELGNNQKQRLKNYQTTIESSLAIKTTKLSR
jgi:hypothetical protein